MELAAERGGATSNADTKITPANVEQIAVGCKSAKDALQVYLTLLADNSFSDDAKAAAKARLPYWKDLAAKDYVRQGTKWVPRDEVQKSQEVADKLLDDAIKMLVAKNSAQARAKLEGAMRVDPADTDSAYLLGILAGLEDRNYSKAATYFAECMRRDPSDALAVSDHAMASIMAYQHGDAAKDLQTLAGMDPSSLAAAHNLHLAIEASGMRHLFLSPTVAGSYNRLVNLFKVQEDTMRPRTGWLYLLPDSLSKKILDLPHGNGISITPQWVEDKACIACQGRGWVTCPDCNGSGVITRQKPVRTGTDPVTGLATYTLQPVNESCSRCNGTGKISCPYCQGERIDPMLLDEHHDNAFDDGGIK